MQGWTLIGLLLLALTTTADLRTASAQAGTGVLAPATPKLTTLTDMIYRADGTPAGGSVVVTWPAFAAASGASVPQGSVAIPLSAGVLTVQLVANQGSTPVGSYYTAIYHLDDGSVSKEYWVVPAQPTTGSTPVRLAQVRSQVLPTSVAMQTVSKSYVDTAIAAATGGHPLDSSPYVLKAGDTMTGPLVLPADPVSANQAADKHYVDASVAGVTGGSGVYVSTIPTATQTVTQPNGTQLAANLLNGTVYPQEFITGTGNLNGIANALASPNCTGGCDLHVERTYGQEAYTVGTLPGTTRIEDVRNGMVVESVKDPFTSSGEEVGHAINVVSTATAASVFQAGAGSQAFGGLLVTHQGLAGGNNLFPESAEASPPYFKTNYKALEVQGSYNTAGQHILAPKEIDCYGVGDCLIGTQTIVSSGGVRDDADEGTHPFDLQILEDARVFTGNCESGCTTGSTSLMVQVATGGHTQGEGRFLIDRNPAKTITGNGTGVGAGGGVLTNSGAGLPHPGAYFTDTNFAVSTFFQTTNAITSQANDIAPGTVTEAIATTNVPATYQTNTAGAPTASGVACIVDQLPGNVGPTNFEMAAYTVIDASHIRLTNLGKPHAAAATIAIGGLCGYGLEQTVDTINGLRQVFPVVGSLSATSLYYSASATAILAAPNTTSGYVNASSAITSLARSNGVVTVTTAGSLGIDVNGLTLTVAGAADQSYNGAYIVTTTGANTLTYAQAGANSTSSGGTVGIVTGAFALYPLAEVLSVFDAATGDVDGLMTLGANTVAWAAGDLVEEPHYYQQNVQGDQEFISQVLPRAYGRTGPGIYFEANTGPGLFGWSVTNGVPATNYLGNGGTHTIPDAAYEAVGAWRDTMIAQAGDEAVFQITCNSHACNRWNSGYNLFELESAASQDTIAWAPQTSTLGINLRGTQYSFAPQGATLPTLNATTLNATTLNATTVNATTLNGTLSNAQLTGGTINGVAIGGTRAAAANFTQLTVTGSATNSMNVSPNGNGVDNFPHLQLFNTAGNGKGYIDFFTYTNQGLGTPTARWRAEDTGGYTGASVFSSSTFGGPNLAPVDVMFVGNTGQTGSVNNLVGVGILTVTPTKTFCVGTSCQFGVDAVGNVAGVLYQEQLTTPASSSAACLAGQFTDDANYHYVCVANSQWKRAALSTF